MTTTVVRYHTRPEAADENQRLVEAVYAELATRQPGSFSYTTFRLDDGMFVHIAEIEGSENPLTSLPAFAAFVQHVGERCEPGQGPNPQTGQVVGTYRASAQ
jgi:hypothetical protein